MNKSMKTSFKTARWALLLLAVVGLVAATGSYSTVKVSANHPVLVEGNCDSPVPGTTIVTAGTCGDFDGDGRIGTAEDTDGADRIFGTITAALGPGTGAAAGTGANMNGRLIIVTSGRFAEAVSIAPVGAISTVGNVQLEAAPGVEANIDAVLQGDPAGGNTARQAGVGILVNSSPGRTVTLRNLTIRNFTEGVRAINNSRVHLDHCRIDNNLEFGLRATQGARLTVENSRITSTGRRTPAPAPPVFGHGIQMENLSGGGFTNTVVVNSVGAALNNLSTSNQVRIFHFIHLDNDGGPIIGNPVIKEDF